MTGAELAAEIAEAIAQDSRLDAIREKIEAGTADLKDSEQYTAICAEITGRMMRGAVAGLDDREESFTEIARERYRETFDIYSTVQAIIDRALGIRIAAKEPGFQEDRARKIGHALEDQTVPESTILRRAESASENFVMSQHDRCVEENAKFRDRAGLQSYAVRTGGAKCCQWCADVSGKYPANETPDGFWGRHDKCKCSILYESRRGTQLLGGTSKKWEVAAEGAGAGELHRLSGAEAAAAGAPEPVVFTKEQAARVVAVQAGTMDYMSNSFRPKLSSSTETFHFNAAKIPVYRVQNSDFQLYTDNPNPKAKATRTAEKLLRAALPFLPDGFEIPPVLVVDFNAHGLNLDSSGNKHDVIGGFVAELGVMFLNSQYNTYEKILQYVRRNEGFFANHTVLAPVLHELGHKYYEDCVKGLANSGGMSYNEAKQMINRAIFEQLLMMEKSSVILSDAISIYADIGYKRQKFSEVIAESFSVMQENQAAKGIIKSLEVLRNDGFK